jgi:hypothetical protein
MLNKITYATQCYEKDYLNVLNEEHLTRCIFNNNYDFLEKIIIINPSKDYSNIIKCCDKLIDKNIITNYYIAEKYTDKICNFFNINRNIPAFYTFLYGLLPIYLSKAEYLLFYTGDAWAINPVNWIDDSVSLINSNNLYKSCNLSWCKDIGEDFAENDKFYFSRVSFSDQNFFIKIADFRKNDIMNYNSSKTDFPLGNTFEYKMCAYMEKYNYIICTYKNGFYLHKNW